MAATDTPSVDVARVIAAYGDLPTLAPVAVEVLRLSDDQRATLEDIAEVIRRDPGLASQLLRVANSPMYGMGGEITSLARAGAVLGLRTVKLLSLSFSVVTRPAQGDEAALMVWRHTLVTSAIAQNLARRREPRLADECFIAGLLADMGRLALAEEPHYVAARTAAGGWLDADAERAAIGITSNEITAQILAGWSLPAVLAQAISHVDRPDAIDGPGQRVARILAVADAAARLLIAEEDAAPAALEKYNEIAALHLRAGDEEVEQLLIDAGSAVAETAAMFQTESPTELPVSDLLSRAKDGLSRLTLDMVAALSQEEHRAAELASENQRLASEAATDVLTGLPNRRSYEDTIDREIANRMRNPQPTALGLLLMDLDKFKSVNDAHGHQVGDDVLRAFAARLGLHTRRNEFAARVGGEEFVVIIPVTDAAEIPLAAERFRAAVAAEPFETGIGPLDVTVSIGVASTVHIHHDVARELYEAADKALYEAKESGRDRFAVSPLA